MTEPEWLACTDPTRMLYFLQGNAAATDRKLRLFGVACCRRISHLLADERSRKSVDTAERYADGEVGAAELREASNAWAGPVYTLGREAVATEAAAEVTYGEDEYGPAYHLSLLAYHAFYAVGEDKSEYVAQCDILRDIFGPLPLRPVPSDPSWRTSTCVELARGMYEARAFGPLPILSDALSDAGCTDDQILGHCRGGGQHHRGCWVVDLVLGKC